MKHIEAAKESDQRLYFNLPTLPVVHYYGFTAIRAVGPPMVIGWITRHQLLAHLHSLKDQRLAEATRRFRELAPGQLLSRPADWILYRALRKKIDPNDSPSFIYRGAHAHHTFRGYGGASPCKEVTLPGAVEAIKKRARVMEWWRLHGSSQSALRVLPTDLRSFVYLESRQDVIDDFASMYFFMHTLLHSRHCSLIGTNENGKIRSGPFTFFESWLMQVRFTTCLFAYLPMILAVHAQVLVRAGDGHLLPRSTTVDRLWEKGTKDGKDGHVFRLLCHLFPIGGTKRLVGSAKLKYTPFEGILSKKINPWKGTMHGMMYDGDYYEQPPDIEDGAIAVKTFAHQLVANTYVFIESDDYVRENAVRQRAWYTPIVFEEVKSMAGISTAATGASTVASGDYIEFKNVPMKAVVASMPGCIRSMHRSHIPFKHRYTYFSWVLHRGAVVNEFLDDIKTWWLTDYVGRGKEAQREWALVMRDVRGIEEKKKYAHGMQVGCRGLCASGLCTHYTAPLPPYGDEYKAVKKAKTMCAAAIGLPHLLFNGPIQRTIAREKSQLIVTKL